MYKDRTENYDPKIHKEYLKYDTSFPPTTPCIPTDKYTDYSISINTTNWTEMQQ